MLEVLHKVQLEAALEASGFVVIHGRSKRIIIIPRTPVVVKRYRHVPRLWITLRNDSARPVVDCADVGICLPTQQVRQLMPTSLEVLGNRHPKL